MNKYTRSQVPKAVVSSTTPFNKGILLQRSAVDSAAALEATPIVHDVLRSPGQPLDPATRAFMEPRFGHDFSQVRVLYDREANAVTGSVLPNSEMYSERSKPFRIFDDSRSRAIADRIGAHGFTHKGDIYLGSMVDRPHMPSRQEVINHEMVHVKQTWNAGPYASERALEREANGTATKNPQLAADPDQVLGLWWFIPIAVGVYILLRPKVANAPGPKDPVYESPSDLQIVGEALALFAVPSAVAGALGRLGYGVVSAYALSGATSSVAFRGVQDIAAGQFSGIDAYILDATTGAVIGVVVGGIVRVFAGAGGVAPTGQPSPSLIHLTDEAGQAGIQSSGVLRGSQGIYAIPSEAATEGMAKRFLRTLVSPSRTLNVIPIPDESVGLFSRPSAVGPVSLYQRLVGVYRAPTGVIDLTSGAFTPSGQQFANITGQFWPYGVDSLIWIAAGTASGITFSSSATETGAGERGIYQPLYDLISQQPPLPNTQRNDGPFILLQEQGEGASSSGPTGSYQAVGAAQQQPVFDPTIYQRSTAGQLRELGLGSGRTPAIIFVTPALPFDQSK